MATIHFSRQHRLDRDAVRAQVQKLAEKIGSELSASYHWQGDRLVFRRSGAEGYVEIGDGEVELEIRLGMLLSPLKGRIEATVRDYLDEHLV